jgi:hypothetical protein
MNSSASARRSPIAVAIFAIAVTFIPILAAHYLTREGEHTMGTGK